MHISSIIVAQAYGSGPYGSCTYGGTCGATVSTNSGAAAASGSILGNTGFDLLLAATLACAIIFTALMVRFWRRPGKSGSKVTE